jgi:hypothetical protein
MSRPNAEPPRISFQMVERKVGDLWVDPNVQRTLRKARVTKIADEFQASALGVLTTSYRSPKRIHIIDGQHRYRAAEAAAYTGDMSDRLSKVPGGPDGLLGNARGQKLTRTGDLSTQVARIVVDLYNQRRRTTALTRWE